MQLQIDNEYDPLEAVLVHRPGPEIERLTHENMKDFLFEDIPYLRRMQQEHDAFVAKMRVHGIEVVYVEQLLAEIMTTPDIRAAVVDEICSTEGVPALGAELRDDAIWNREQLVEILYAGMTNGEFADATGKRVAPAGAEHEFLLPPIPNAYFTRDPAVIVRHSAISCKMHYRQRIRETIIARAIFERHPWFVGNELTYGGTSEPTEDRPYTIEGGDVIVLSPEAVLVGDSERTRSETIELLAAKCFRYGHVQRVYEIPIPTERTFMHLDTVFTILDRGVVLWYPEVMENLEFVHRYEPDPNDPLQVQRVPENRDLPTLLADEFDCELTVIPTAGGSKHYAAREQRTDGANAFAIAPRVAITYERNEYTIKALKNHGVNCIEIDDSELVRGLGGPRCMTMPLRRAHQRA